MQRDTHERTKRRRRTRHEATRRFWWWQFKEGLRGLILFVCKPTKANRRIVKALFTIAKHTGPKGGELVNFGIGQTIRAHGLTEVEAVALAEAAANMARSNLSGFAVHLQLDRWARFRTRLRG